MRQELGTYLYVTDAEITALIHYKVEGTVGGGQHVTEIGVRALLAIWTITPGVDDKD